MKKFCMVLLCCLSLVLIVSAATAEGGSAAAVNPFLPVRAADMTLKDAEAAEDGSVTVRTGSVLSLACVDFAAGGTILRLQAVAPAEGRLGVRVFLDDPEGKALASVAFSPMTKECRYPFRIEGVHDVYITFDHDGTFIGWQVFTSAEDIEAAIRAERTEEYEDSIPTRYSVKCDRGGTVEPFTYEAHDYANEQEVYEKCAFVYLPYGYDPSRTYSLLILCHGIGGSEYEWGLTEGSSRVRCIMDNLIDRGEIEPFIVVTPNGRAGRTADYSSFYLFDQELRNDLLPALAERYAVDIHDRSRCAMAGLSMGGMQTINIGIGKCLDLFSAFGAFSAAPTSNPASVTAVTLNAAEDLPIRVFYSICGTEDSIALASSDLAVNRLDELTDALDEHNFIVQHVPGGHDFGVWYLGFYNFARLFGGEP